MIIYKITNSINDKVYIGQTVRTINRRWSRHKGALRESNKTPLYNAIRKYGWDKFKIEEIDGANSLSELNYKEWLLIHKYNTLWPNGYNMREGGQNSGFPEKSKKKVINIKTGEQWDTVRKCAYANGIRYNTLCNLLNGGSFNKTDLRYLGEEEKSWTERISKRGAKKYVINIKTGEQWDSLKEYSNTSKFKYSYLKGMLNGCHVNKTNLRYVGQEDLVKIKIKKTNTRIGKKVINIKTGEIYKCAREAWRKTNLHINYGSFTRKLRNERPNNTDFKYLKQTEDSND